MPAACDVRGADVLNVCGLAERGPARARVRRHRARATAPTSSTCVDRVAPRFPRVGFAAVAVREDLDELQRRLRERRWRVPLGYDHDGAAAALYGLGAVCPLFTFADGPVAGSHVGVLDERELAERVEALQEGRPLP